MISIKEKEKLLQNLKNKSLNSFTIEYIVQYANIATDIFNINHEILITRLSENLNENIKFNQISNAFGGYISKSKQIFISPKIKNKQHITSLIFHELDHVANYQYIESEDKLKYLAIYFQRLNKKFPFILKFPFIKSFITKRVLNSNFFSSGFNNPLVGKALGVNLNLFKEGFTTYKQSKYEQYLNLSDKLTIENNHYKNAMKVAQLIIEIIGEDTIMQLEQDNNILGLKTLFENITQNQVPFEKLIRQLNSASIDSNRILENQGILNTTLNKILLCKKASDYGIVLDSPDLPLSQIQNLITSYEKKLDFQTNMPPSRNHNFEDKAHDTIIFKEDYYSR